MKFLIHIASFLCLLNLFGQDANIDNQLLWEISGNGLKNESYLFGSFHTNDKRVFKFGDSTYFALNNAKAIVLEANLMELFDEFDTRNESVNILLDQSGNPYSGTKKATKTVYGDEDGMPQFLDAYFQQYCYNSGKLFYPLETIEDQMNLLNDESKFELNFNEIEARVVSEERILKLYLAGDIFALDKVMKTGLAVYPGMYQGLIIDRNFIMAQGIDTLIKKQSCFVAVGAGHLAGDEGLINLLRKKGYRLRKVGYKFSEEGTLQKNQVLAQRTYTCLNEEFKFKVTFPGKPLVQEQSESELKLIYRELGQGNTYEIEAQLKEEGSLEAYATDYIQSPRSAQINYKTLDDGTWIAEGISDTYPEGLAWVRIIEGEKYVLIVKAYGGNKFMNSKRPEKFFNSVFLDVDH